MNPKLASLQIIFFFDESIADSIEADDLSSTFRNKLPNLKLKPTILDVPKEIDDIPFLIMEDNGEYRITVTYTRADFFYFSKEPKKIEEEKGLLQGHTTTIYDILVENSIKINRVGNVATFVVDNDDPIKRIKDKFINKHNEFDEFDEFLIKMTKKENVDSIPLNVSTTITTGSYSVNEKEERAIIVERDIKSIKEANRDFDKKFFTDLINTANTLCASDVISSLLK